MASESKLDDAKRDESQPNDGNTCFIIMPISDRPGYPPGHFNSVYRNIIKPAVEATGYIPERADENRASNIIHVEIIKKIIQSPMALCDISSLNANVMFELGIRQAFQLPVVIIKDDATTDPFDTSPLRRQSYNSNLLYDNVIADRSNLARAIEETKTQRDAIISLVQLTGLHTGVNQYGLSSDSGDRLNAIEHRLDGIAATLSQMNAPLSFGRAGGGLARLGEGNKLLAVANGEVVDRGKVDAIPIDPNTGLAEKLGEIRALEELYNPFKKSGK